MHRWAGGLLGLLLALIGLSGAILVHKDAWIGVAHAGDPLVREPAVIGRATARMMAEPGVHSIVYAGDGFGLHQLRTAGDSGAYADQAGQIVTRWSSQWQRPELWLFDFHHHLFSGDIGETVIGIAGLAAILFVLTGTILWWRTRRTFKPRMLPKRLSRPAIIVHHRDLGIVAAPLLLLSAVTGTMMIFRPVAELAVAPFGSYGSVAAALAPPKVKSGALAARSDWQGIIAAAHARFPDATIRILALPRKPGDPIQIRMKRAAEWLPNGRSTLWIDAADGRILAARDALSLPPGAQLFNKAYPLHSAKVGGLVWRLVMTLSGLALTLLGTLAVWSFWFKRPRLGSKIRRPGSSPA